MKRRSFLKSVGLTIGALGVGGTSLVIAQPEHEGVDKYLSEKKEMYKHLYSHGDTPEDVIKKAIEVAPELETVVFERGQVPERELVSEATNSYIPEMWAQQSLAILEESMITGALIQRDFHDQIHQYGDVINTMRPGEFCVDPHGYCSGIVNQPIILKDHFFSEIKIKDGESLSMSDISRMHLQPAMIGLSRVIDLAILEAFQNFTSPTIVENTSTRALIGARERLNDNKCFPRGRHAVISPKMEVDLFQDISYFQNQDNFVGFDVHIEPSMKNGVAFHEKAATLVCRPLPMPMTNMGVDAGQSTRKDLHMRCVLRYDPSICATVATFDILTGSAVTDENMLCKVDVH